MPLCKKILIIYPVNFEGNLNKGIFDKMIGQGEAFEALGHKVTYAFIEGSRGIIKQNDKKELFSKSWSYHWTKYQTFFADLKKHPSIHLHDVFYIRHLLHTRSLFFFLKAIKSKKSQVIYEYPTLPYETEWRKPLHKIVLLEDSFVKRRIEQFFDKVVHFGGYQGKTKSVQITNGITIQSKCQPTTYKAGVFSMIAVGRWEYWHGLDRLIKGISESHQKIKLHIVGDGPSLNDYQSIAKNLSLKDKVRFYPPMYNAGLEQLISKCHLGVGTLGLHRKGVDTDSSLKHRMYCSYGLPFLFAGRDADFTDDLEYVFEVEANEEIIDIDSIIHSYVYRDVDHAEIKEYALTNLSWLSRMKKVIEL